jgi:hypothetical protein
MGRLVIEARGTAAEGPAVQGVAATALYFRDFCVRVSGFGVALRAGHDFGWRSGTDVNATRPLL